MEYYSQSLFSLFSALKCECCDIATVRKEKEDDIDMNFGQNIFSWAQTNLQPLAMVALIAIGLFFFIERKFSKLAGLLVVAVIAVGFIFATSQVKDIFLALFNQVFG